MTEYLKFWAAGFIFSFFQYPPWLGVIWWKCLIWIHPFGISFTSTPLCCDDSHVCLTLFKRIKENFSLLHKASQSVSRWTLHKKGAYFTKKKTEIVVCFQHWNRALLKNTPQCQRNTNKQSTSTGLIVLLDQSVCWVIITNLEVNTVLYVQSQPAISNPRENYLTHLKVSWLFKFTHRSDWLCWNHRLWQVQNILSCNWSELSNIFCYKINFSLKKIITLCSKNKVIEKKTKTIKNKSL